MSTQPRPQAAAVAAALHQPLPPVAAESLARVRSALSLGIELRQQLLESGATAIAVAGALVVGALRSGGKLLLCGNGGSAADCQHIAAELTGRFSKSPRPALAAVALTTDSSALTAIANDFGYEQVFSRQVEALGRPGDVLLAISTSGRSPNVLRAAERAGQLGLTVVALVGPQPSELGALAAITICAPGSTTDRIQELHLTVGHILCDLVDRAFIGSGP
jgi:D-sedoheptulose 7-phosphate isomerase